MESKNNFSLVSESVSSPLLLSSNVGDGDGFEICLFFGFGGCNLDSKFSLGLLSETVFSPLLSNFGGIADCGSSGISFGKSFECDCNNFGNLVEYGDFGVSFGGDCVFKRRFVCFVGFNLSSKNNFLLVSESVSSPLLLSSITSTRK